jgi:uncharacterized protein (DUF779 family)
VERRIELISTLKAVELTDALKARYERLVSMISGGCCDNTAPMLLDGFLVGEGDVCLGEVAAIERLRGKGVRPDVRWLKAYDRSVQCARGRGVFARNPIGKVLLPYLLPA